MENYQQTWMTSVHLVQISFLIMLLNIQKKFTISKKEAKKISYLGLQISQTKSGIKIHWKDYIRKKLRELKLIILVRNNINCYPMKLSSYKG